MLHRARSGKIPSRFLWASAKMVFLALILFTNLFVSLTYAKEKIYKNLKESEITFRGVEGQDIDINLIDCIPIGLFVPVGKDTLGDEILKGVQRAIDEENKRGGFKGKKFCIKRRWSDDPWGTGSKDVINLIYKDHVLGIIAYKDGASHIALQIAAKMNISILSPVTTDLSLTMTGVPWIFRLPPDDKKQAETIYLRGIKKTGLKRLGIISEIDHDIRLAVIEIIKVLNSNKRPPVFHINIKQSQNDVQMILKKINKAKPDGIILALKKNNFLNLLSIFKKNKINIPVYSVWMPEIKKTDLKKNYAFSLYFVDPFRNIKSSMTHSAIYSYDCTRMLINSIKHNGLNRSKIRKGIKELSGYRGMSGKIIWENNGNNKTDPGLIQN